MTAMKRPKGVENFGETLKDNNDIALYSHIFERPQEIFSVSEIQQEMQGRGVYMDSKDLRERLSRFVEFGFLDEEYRMYVRRKLCEG